MPFVTFLNRSCSALAFVEEASAVTKFFLTCNSACTTQYIRKNWNIMD
jgi:hypothetical protein